MASRGYVGGVRMDGPGLKETRVMVRRAFGARRLERERESERIATDDE
jgi:hypothetical protein